MSIRGTDFIGVLESAYDISVPEGDWLLNIARATTRLFPTGHGAFALSYEADTDVVRNWRGHGLGPNAVGRILGPLQGRAPDGGRATDFFPAPVWQRLMAPFPRAATMQAAFPRHSRDPFMESYLGAIGNQLGIRGTDAGGSGVTVVCPWPRPRLPVQRRAWFERLGTHLAAAYRLRQALKGAPALNVAEAVFSATGQLQHLAVDSDGELDADDGNEPGRAGRTVNRDELACILGDRARRVREALGPVRQISPSRALSLWQGLFDGRWSVVAHSDRDGKRLMLAFRNPPEVCSALALSRRERQVVGLLCQGCSPKHVSYELGLTPSTVSAHTKKALLKLRLRDLTELLALTAT